MITLGQFAENLEERTGLPITSDAVIDWLQGHRLINDELEPYPKYVACGWFFLDYTPTPAGLEAVPFLTESGQAHFAELITNYYT